MKTVYYVCNGAKLECPEGSAPSFLGVARPNVSLCGQSMANIMDYSLGVNITPFGLCGSLANPQVAAATAANNGVLQRMPCIPQMPLPWAGGENGVSVNGQPALLDTSTCKCTWAPAGAIEIKDAGQNVVSCGGQGSPKIETGTTKTETAAVQQSAGGDVGAVEDNGKKDVDNSDQNSRETGADAAEAGEDTNDSSTADNELAVRAEEETETDTSCGIRYRNDILCVNVYKKIYGPYYRGKLALENYDKWDILLSQNKITNDEKDIIICMSVNEGNLDSVQSYDSEIVSVGAMQKTINPDGNGEFPIQMAEFKNEYPERFKHLFENCGWTVTQEKGKWRAYYNGETGAVLQSKIRSGFSESNVKKKVLCIPVEPLINAAKDPYFQAKQINDFIDRLNKEILLKIKPSGYNYLLKDYLKSKLGKTVVLDHHVNRPGWVQTDFGDALNNFYKKNKEVSKNPNEWGEKHEEYEQKIVDYYGKNRRGTDMPLRYENLIKQFKKKGM